MKRFAAILVTLAVAVILAYVSYIKGHYDGARAASVSGLTVDTVVFDDMERHGLERAKSRLGMLITLRYDNLNSGSSWLTNWREWRKVDTASNFERHREQAREISDQHREGIPTLKDLMDTLEEKFPDATIEFQEN